jgi:putative SOS response-associated peptidase YedK
MCGRYAINQTGMSLSATLAVEWAVDEPVLPRFNVAPQTDAPVLRTRRDGSQALDSMRWGLVPYWAKDPRLGQKLVNARCETAATNSSFRTALQRRRCLVPASGFYEWTGATKKRIPHWLHPAQGELILMAGLWEAWRPGPESPFLRSFTILTAAANEDVAPLHDRMPVLIRPEDREAWLDPATPEETYAAMLRPAPPSTLAHHPVSPAVNRAAEDGPALIERVAEEPPPLLLF